MINMQSQTLPEMEWVTVAQSDPKFYLRVVVRRKSIRRRTKIRKLLRGGKYK